MFGCPKTKLELSSMPTEASVVRSHTLEKMALTNSVIADFRTCLGVERTNGFKRKHPWLSKVQTANPNWVMFISGNRHVLLGQVSLMRYLGG
jgi:hypothetical protein